VKIIVFNNTIKYYRYLRKNYEKTTKKLRLYYGSADYRSLQVTTVYTGHYGHYRFREKVTGFADEHEQDGRTHQ
jgi:hypothetical protein